MCAAPSSRKAFILFERLGEKTLEAYSCGNGRYIPGTPGADIEVCFRVDKDESSLDIQIYDVNLLQWLRAIFLPHSIFNDVLSDDSITMRTLLPRYPEMSAKLDQDKREGHSVDVLELFVRHFLREGSIFACFGFERLYEEQILTGLHFHDIYGQNHSISEDLDLLDEAIDELDKEDAKGSTYPFPLVKEPFLSQLRTAIKQHDPILVQSMLAQDPGSVDAKTLCLAIRYYESAIFHRLLEHGAQVDSDNLAPGPLYHASKAGNTEAVQLLLSHGANIEGGNSCIGPTPLSAAAFGGHFGIVQYLFEEKGAKIDGSGYKSPLSRAIKRRHTHIVDYLLRAGANVLEDDCSELLAQYAENKAINYGGIIERSIADMDKEARDFPLGRAVPERYPENVQCLKEDDANISPDKFDTIQLPLPPAVTSDLLKTFDFSSIHGVNEDYYAIGSSAFTLSNKAPLYASSNNLSYKQLSAGPPAESNGLYAIGSSAFTLPSEVYHSASLNNLSYEQLSAGQSTKSIQLYDHLLYGQLFHDVRILGPTGIRQPKGHESHSLAAAAEQAEVRRTMKPQLLVQKQRTMTYQLLAKERRTMAGRLLAEVANSCERLVDASTEEGASASLIAFVDHVGTRLSVWGSGTRAIRDICEGCMPRWLSDIVSALQVADAMRLAVPPSQLRCSKKEFVDDIPRWAALLSSDDQSLFSEIASCLWGLPELSIPQEGTDNFSRPLEFFQLLVDHLVRASGLFDHRIGNFWGSYRLQPLRQQYFSTTSCTHTGEGRLPLTKWCPLPTQDAQEKTHTISSKSPDPEEGPEEGPAEPEVEQSRILARITVFMAGAIFGTVLLYLCLSRHGFSTLQMPILNSNDWQGWALGQVITRNYVILTIYLGFTSPTHFGSWKSTNFSLHGNPLSERVQDYTAAVQSSRESQHIILDSLSAVDTIMELAPADSSPSVLTRMTTSSSATTISPSLMTTPRTVPTSTGALMDGTIYCEHCTSKFKLGRNGRRGQASNLQKHIKNYHPETLQNYHREIHKCRYGCGTVDPSKWNIKAHEEKHCANRKGKQSRRHGKWRHVTTKTS